MIQNCHKTQLSSTTQDKTVTKQNNIQIVFQNKTIQRKMSKNTTIIK